LFFIGLEEFKNVIWITTGNRMRINTTPQMGILSRREGED
jgi:hypothetical protein